MNILEQTSIKDRLVVCDESEAITLNRLRKVRELFENIASVMYCMTDEDIKALAMPCFDIINELQAEYCWLKKEIKND